MHGDYNVIHKTLSRRILGIDNNVMHVAGGMIMRRWEGRRGPISERIASIAAHEHHYTCSRRTGNAVHSIFEIQQISLLR
ncbi:unnamed protein product [Leptosia nina]|uniref:Uncharacterized protein n=1 Tax=Leptosia nina TaxID=320188 RepID=A0AAV1JLB3_9NEOP